MFISMCNILAEQFKEEKKQQEEQEEDLRSQIPNMSQLPNFSSLNLGNFNTNMPSIPSF